MRHVLRALPRLAVATAIAFAAGGAAAQDFKPLRLNIVGNVANIPQSNEIEAPVFNGLSAKSGGKVQVRFRTFHPFFTVMA